MRGIFTTLVILLSIGTAARSHGVLTGVSGANGVNAIGFAVVEGTPRDTGRGVKKVEGDTSIIRDKEIKSGKVQGCGRTEFGGNTDVATSLAAASAAGLPSAAADGSVTMTLHQVNGDGAGPYACDVSASGSATDFVAMQVTQNVPGENSRSKNKATNFTLIAQMPAGTACTGGPGGDACVVRCRNSAAAGPFGGCAAVTNSGSAGNSTAAVASASSAAATGAAASVDSAAGASAPVASAAGASAPIASAAATGTVADATSSADAAASTKAAEKGKGKGLLAKLAGRTEERADVRKRWIASRVVNKGAAWI